MNNKIILMIVILLGILIISGCESEDNNVENIVNQEKNVHGLLDFSLQDLFGINNFEIEEKIDRNDNGYLFISINKLVEYECPEYGTPEYNEYKIKYERDCEVDAWVNNVFPKANNKTEIGAIFFLSKEEFYDKNYYIIEYNIDVDDPSKETSPGFIQVTYKTTSTNIEHYLNDEISFENFFENIYIDDPFQ